MELGTYTRETFSLCPTFLKKRDITAGFWLHMSPRGDWGAVFNHKWDITEKFWLHMSPRGDWRAVFNHKWDITEKF